MSDGADDLQKVREEIGLADEALVRDLVALDDAGSPDWERRAAGRPAFRFRVDLGVRVAESKFRRDPEAYRPLARARDEKGLERMITDARVEAGVFDRVRRQTLACGGSPALAERVAVLYRDRVIPETKAIQIRRLCELA
jgi:chorismate mutase